MVLFLRFIYLIFILNLCRLILENMINWCFVCFFRRYFLAWWDAKICCRNKNWCFGRWREIVLLGEVGKDLLVIWEEINLFRVEGDRREGERRKFGEVEGFAGLWAERARGGNDWRGSGRFGRCYAPDFLLVSNNRIKLLILSLPILLCLFNLIVFPILIQHKFVTVTPILFLIPHIMSHKRSRWQSNFSSRVQLRVIVRRGKSICRWIRDVRCLNQRLTRRQRRHGSDKGQPASR